jgi:hypothetical protein
MDMLVGERVPFSLRRCFRWNALAPRTAAPRSDVRVFLKGMALQCPTQESPDGGVFASPMNLLPDLTIEPDPSAGAHKFALSQNSKSLQAGSNPSERILIIRGIVTALDRPPRSCDTAIRVARLRRPQTS